MGSDAVATRLVTSQGYFTVEMEIDSDRTARDLYSISMEKHRHNYSVHKSYMERDIYATRARASLRDTFGAHSKEQMKRMEKKERKYNRFLSSKCLAAVAADHLELRLPSIPYKKKIKSRCSN